MAGDIKAANCPNCGRFMDKVEARIVKQLGEGTLQVNATVTAWACPNPKCQKET